MPLYQVTVHEDVISPTGVKTNEQIIMQPKVVSATKRFDAVMKATQGVIWDKTNVQHVTVVDIVNSA